jgi:hypothetical protein
MPTVKKPPGRKRGEVTAGDPVAAAIDIVDREGGRRGDYAPPMNVPVGGSGPASRCDMSSPVVDMAWPRWMGRPAQRR